MDCQPYARNHTSGNQWNDVFALVPAIPALMDGALANYQQCQTAPALALEVGTDTGETYLLEIYCYGGAFQVAVDGRVVDGTPWASLRAAVAALVATVLDIWDAE